MEDFGSR